MGLNKKSIIDIQCDSCDSHASVEGDEYGRILDEAGWRIALIAIQPVDDSLRSSQRKRAPEERFLCGECLVKLKSLVNVYEGDGEAELAKLKSEIEKKTSQRMGPES